MELVFKTPDSDSDSLIYCESDSDSDSNPLFWKEIKCLKVGFLQFMSEEESRHFY